MIVAEIRTFKFYFIFFFKKMFKLILERIILFVSFNYNMKLVEVEGQNGGN